MMKTKPNLLLLEKENYSNALIQKLKSFFNVTIENFNNQNSLDDFLIYNEFEVIITKLGLFLGEKNIGSQKNLKVICTPTTGYNHIEVNYLNEKRIKLIGLKNEEEFLKNIKSTAEHTWSLVLALSRNLLPAIHETKSHSIWNKQPYLAYELNGKTLGIIGYGRLGKIIGEYGNTFGMNVLANDSNLKVFKNKPDYIKESKINDLISKSDFIVILISWHKKNIKFFNHELFDMIKESGAFIINTSRGEFIDDEALLHYFKVGKIKGIALDVLDGDSSWDSVSVINNKIFELSKLNNNVIITPHIGGYGDNSIKMTRKFITEKLVEYYQKIK